MGDETTNSCLVGRWIHNLTHSCTSSSEWNLRSRMSFFRSPKTWKSQGERSGLYGGCWSVSSQISEAYPSPDCQYEGGGLSCKMTIPSDSIPGRFDFMARRSTLSHQETNHTSLPFFAYLNFQCWTNTLYTTLTSRIIKKQLCGLCVFTMYVSYPTDESVDT